MQAFVFEETMEIPTYAVGQPDKNPLFLENRVYQGSSGKVYPFPVIDKIYDQKVKKSYRAVILENEYLKITFLPELGGRVYRAVDKTNGYDFVYYNEVIKPALVGLLGPWVSGGIEFNWPQHHRPTTFMPVDYRLRQYPDGSAGVQMGETDRMYGTKSLAEFILQPGKAYLEIRVRLWNPTPFPQTFLWWANPALAAGEHTRAIFPPDVTAVYDHGRRDVSTFPIATGTYYKVDYSAGVDISRYKNIPVPTSYMACASRFDFVGGYDDEKDCGMLHVADHHVSPGKKQWTWGCGDFGKAWDRNLTDENGPYVELMTGVYTDNQPDFTWLKPFEEKTFTQYFLPFKQIGTVRNATKDIVVSCAYRDGAFGGGVYATSRQEGLRVCLRAGDKTVFEEKIGEITPHKAFLFHRPHSEESAQLTVRDAAGRLLVSCTWSAQEPAGEEHKPLEAPPLPADTETTEELYFTGMHLEQYRHPTYRPEDYYAEGLRRDPDDTRLNLAYGRLLLRQGALSKAEPCLRRALKRITRLNHTPYDGEVHYLLGLCCFYQGKPEAAYDWFRKGEWDGDKAAACAYFAAALKTRQGDYPTALAHAEKALERNPKHSRALGLMAALLESMGQEEAAGNCLEALLVQDPFDPLAGLPEGETAAGRSHKQVACLEAAACYMEWGFYEKAARILESAPAGPQPLYYAGYCRAGLGDEAGALALYQKAEKADSAYCFPNRIWDLLVLEDCRRRLPGAPMAGYYLGLLLYDKRQYAEARDCFRAAIAGRLKLAAAHRCLAIYLFNKEGEGKAALAEMEKAFSLSAGDARILLELDQLHKKAGAAPEERLAGLEAHLPLTESRDDLYTEYITLLNLTGQWEKALGCLEGRRFHPWEGGEGKVTSQHVFSLFRLAAACLQDAPGRALELLEQARRFPENLGEGKLAGARDTQLDYLCGRALEILGEENRARACWERAAAGEVGMDRAMYYNDQPADRLLFKGLSLRKLGKDREAETCFDRLIDYGNAHMQDEVVMDYFAVSLPDFLLFDDDLQQKNRAHCLYLAALGYEGKGMDEEAGRMYRELLQLEPCHIGCGMYRGICGL